MMSFLFYIGEMENRVSSEISVACSLTVSLNPHWVQQDKLINSMTGMFDDSMPESVTQSPKSFLIG